MSDKRRRLENAALALQERYGPQALRPARELMRQLPPHIPTGFDGLDAVTGCGGIPLGALTLLSGAVTSGKTTVAYKSIAQFQAARTKATVALFDCSRTADPDYLQRCGVELARLWIVRPTGAQQALQVLLDLVRRKAVRFLVLDSLGDLLAMPQGRRALQRALSSLYNLLRQENAALLVLDEANPAWLRWFNWDKSASIRPWTALHVELRRDRWLIQAQQLVGYHAQAHVLKTRWGKGGRAELAVAFNGAVRARPTW